MVLSRLLCRAHVLSQSTCSQVIQLANRLGFEPAPIALSGGSGRSELHTELRHALRSVLSRNADELSSQPELQQLYDTMCQEVMTLVPPYVRTWTDGSRFQELYEADSSPEVANTSTMSTSAEATTTTTTTTRPSQLWKLRRPQQCLNEFLRVYKYEGSSGHFGAPHFDYPYQPSEHCSSLYTFLLYLNMVDAQRGGATIFYPHYTYDGNNRWHREVNTVEPEERQRIQLLQRQYYRVQPQAGLVTCFPHFRCSASLLHAAEPLSGDQHTVKYVLRSDVLYEQVQQPSE